MLVWQAAKKSAELKKRRFKTERIGHTPLIQSTLFGAKEKLWFKLRSRSVSVWGNNDKEQTILDRFY